MNRKTENPPQAQAHAAEIVREYGPFDGAERIHGITHDGRHVWAATGANLVAFDPESGETARTLACACDAGTAFDGKYLYQIAEARINKIDPVKGNVVASIPAPGHGSDSGLAWAEGSRAVCGSDSTVIAKSTRSIPRPATCFVPSSPTVSSRA